MRMQEVLQRGDHHAERPTTSSVKYVMHVGSSLVKGLEI